MIESKIFNLNNKKGLKTIILDSSIIGGIAALGMLSNNIPTMDNIYITGKVFFMSFLAQMTFELKIKSYINQKREKKAGNETTASPKVSTKHRQPRF